MPRTESVGEENYRTHRFLEFQVLAPNYDVAQNEAKRSFIGVQDALEDLYVLHMIVKADLKGTGKRSKGVKGVGTEHYKFTAQVFARAVRAENNRFKHIRLREIH